MGGALAIYTRKMIDNTRRRKEGKKKEWGEFNAPNRKSVPHSGGGYESTYRLVMHQNSAREREKDANTKRKECLRGGSNVGEGKG